MSQTAVIIGDLQLGITRKYPFVADLVPHAAALAVAARSRGDLVVFVRTEFRASGADVSARNAGIRAIFEMGDDYHAGSTGVELHPDLAPTADDVVITKHRASAFAGTDLDLVLRANDVESIVVAGVATSAMVAATVYSAADRDYLIQVASDVCADPDPWVHNAFINAIFPSRGVTPRTSAELN